MREGDAVHALTRKLQDYIDFVDGLRSHGKPKEVLIKYDIYKDILKEVVGFAQTHLCIPRQQLEDMIDEREQYLKDWKISVQEPQYSKLWGQIDLLTKLLKGVEG